MKSLTPYLFFDSNCREAMEFYKACFGGELQIMTYADAPEDACPEGDTKPDGDSVMHACLTSGDFMLMASDNSMAAPVAGDNIYIYSECATIPVVQKLFESLSAGGDVKAPLADTFWGSHFGMLTDRYGIHWMLACPLENQGE